MHWSWKLVIMLTVKAIFIWACCVKLMQKPNKILDASQTCKGYFSFSHFDAYKYAIKDTNDVLSTKDCTRVPTLIIIPLNFVLCTHLTHENCSEVKESINMLQLHECKCEATAARWVSLLEVLRLYLVVRFVIKIVNLWIGRKSFGRLLTFTCKMAFTNGCWTLP